jgi:hypothetical protein
VTALLLRPFNPHHRTSTTIVVPARHAPIHPQALLADGCHGMPATDIFYLLDLLMGFQLGFIAVWDARWVSITDGRLVAWFYFRHGMLIINAVAVAPLILQASAGPCC